MRSLIEAILGHLTSIDWLGLIERLFRYVQFLSTAALVTVTTAVLAPVYATRVSVCMAYLASVYLVAPLASWFARSAQTSNETHRKLIIALMTLAGALPFAGAAVTGIGLLTRSVRVDADGIRADIAARRAAEEAFEAHCRAVGSSPYSRCPPPERPKD